MEVLPVLFKVYGNGPLADINSLTYPLSQMLPPLCEMDQTRLSVILPVLAISLSSGTSIDNDSCSTILPNLIDYLLVRDNRDVAKISAGVCTFDLLAQYIKDQSIIEKVLSDTIVPFLLNQIDSIQNSPYAVEHVELLDAINIFTLIGCSSINHAGIKTGTIDEVAKFLATIACENVVDSSYFGIQNPYDLKAIFNDVDAISIVSANALGSILNIECTKAKNRFWKQRILHKVYPLIYPSAKIARMEYGRLLCACHLISCLPVSAFGENKLSNLTAMILDGLKSLINMEVIYPERLDVTRFLSELSITSILKIVNLAPKVVSVNLFLFTSINPDTIYLTIHAIYSHVI